MMNKRCHSKKRSSEEWSRSESRDVNTRLYTCHDSKPPAHLPSSRIMDPLLVCTGRYGLLSPSLAGTPSNHSDHQPCFSKPFFSFLTRAFARLNVPSVSCFGGSGEKLTTKGDDWPDDTGVERPDAPFKAERQGVEAAEMGDRGVGVAFDKPASSPVCFPSCVGDSNANGNGSSRTRSDTDLSPL